MPEAAARTISIETWKDWQASDGGRNWWMFARQPSLPRPSARRHQHSVGAGRTADSRSGDERAGGAGVPGGHACAPGERLACGQRQGTCRVGGWNRCLAPGRVSGCALDCRALGAGAAGAADRGLLGFMGVLLAVAVSPWWLLLPDLWAADWSLPVARDFAPWARCWPGCHGTVHGAALAVQRPPAASGWRELKFDRC